MQILSVMTQAPDVASLPKVWVDSELLLVRRQDGFLNLSGAPQVLWTDPQDNAFAQKLAVVRAPPIQRCMHGGAAEHGCCAPHNPHTNTVAVLQNAGPLTGAPGAAATRQLPGGAGQAAPPSLPRRTPEVSGSATRASSSHSSPSPLSACSRSSTSCAPPAPAHCLHAIPIESAQRLPGTAPPRHSIPLRVHRGQPTCMQPARGAARRLRRVQMWKIRGLTPKQDFGVLYPPPPTPRASPSGTRTRSPRRSRLRARTAAARLRRATCT